MDPNYINFETRCKLLRELLPDDRRAVNSTKALVKILHDKLRPSCSDRIIRFSIAKRRARFFKPFERFAGEINENNPLFSMMTTANDVLSKSDYDHHDFKKTMKLITAYKRSL